MCSSRERDHAYDTHVEEECRFADLRLFDQLFDLCSSKIRFTLNSLPPRYVIDSEAATAIGTGRDTRSLCPSVCLSVGNDREFWKNG